MTSSILGFLLNHQVHWTRVLLRLNRRKRPQEQGSRFNSQVNRPQWAISEDVTRRQNRSRIENQKYHLSKPLQIKIIYIKTLRVTVNKSMVKVPINNQVQIKIQLLKQIWSTSMNDKKRWLLNWVKINWERPIKLIVSLTSMSLDWPWRP